MRTVDRPRGEGYSQTVWLYPETGDHERSFYPMVPDRMNTPPPAGPELEVIRLKANQQVAAVALAVRPRGYRTHWDQRHKQTIPCFRPHSECQGHIQRMPQRYKSYLHVLTHTRLTDRKLERREAFLELTPTAETDLRLGLGSIPIWRGSAFTIMRLNGDKAHLRVAVYHDEKVDLSTLPPERSPYETLMRLWGFLDFPPEQPDSDLFPEDTVG